MDAIELRMGEMRRYIITMIDEHSDYVLALAVPSLNSDIVNHFFSRAARLFPVGISQIITDNGKEFLGSFDKTLQEAAIKHLWTYPYTPKMNAICERFNRALREQFIEFNEILLFEDLALFNLKLAEYLALYNSKRLHKALALTTPVEYILKEINLLEISLMEKSPMELRPLTATNLHMGISLHTVTNHPTAISSLMETSLHMDKGPHMETNLHMATNLLTNKNIFLMRKRKIT